MRYSEDKYTSRGFYIFDIKTEWIPVITVVVSVTTGSILGYIASIMTSRRAGKSEDRKSFILKLEEMYEVVRSIRQNYIEFHNANLQSIMFGEEQDFGKIGKLEMDRIGWRCWREFTFQKLFHR